MTVQTWWTGERKTIFPLLRSIITWWLFLFLSLFAFERQTFFFWWSMKRWAEESEREKRDSVMLCCLMMMRRTTMSWRHKSCLSLLYLLCITLSLYGSLFAFSLCVLIITCVFRTNDFLLSLQIKLCILFRTDASQGQHVRLIIEKSTSMMLMAWKGKHVSNRMSEVKYRTVCSTVPCEPLSECMIDTSVGFSGAFDKWKFIRLLLLLTQELLEKRYNFWVCVVHEPSLKTSRKSNLLYWLCWLLRNVSLLLFLVHYSLICCFIELLQVLSNDWVGEVTKKSND